MKEGIEKSYKLIRQYLQKTPAVKSEILSELLNADIYLKCENQQKTGSFKVRGAFNKLLSLTDEQKQQGIITASTGNHGAGVAYAGSVLNVPATIFAPKNSSKAKLEKMQQYTAKIVLAGSDSAETEKLARDAALERHLPFVSPYNDLSIIQGQGTIAVELLSQIANIDAVYVSVGGGGLISGIGSYLKAINPQINIIGCLPENSPAMSEAVKAGYIKDVPCLPTLSDGTAGNIEADSITFPICQNVVDKFILVSEDDILKAMQLIYQEQGFVIEGAAGVSVAAAMKDNQQHRTSVVILCGGNVNEQIRQSVCKR